MRVLWLLRYGCDTLLRVALVSQQRQGGPRRRGTYKRWRSRSDEEVADDATTQQSDEEETDEEAPPTRIVAEEIVGPTTRRPGRRRVACRGEAWCWRVLVSRAVATIHHYERTTIDNNVFNRSIFSHL